MVFDEEKLKSIIDEVCLIEDIKIEDIPCVDLYMDQVTSFFDYKLMNVKRSDEENILTKTMINNYAKAKILLPIKNKKYTKENIILLTLIYNLKQILSINDISSLLKPLLEELQGEHINSEYLYSMYSQFLQAKNGIEMEFKDSFEKSFDKIKNSNMCITDKGEEKSKLLLAVLLLINGANIQKRMAEKIIDNFFIEDNAKNK